MLGRQILDESKNYVMYDTTDDSGKQIGIKLNQDEHNTRIHFKSKKNCRVVLGFYNYKTEQEISSTKTPEIDDFSFVPDEDIIEKNDEKYYRSSGYSVVERIVRNDKPIIIEHNEDVGMPLEIGIIVLGYSLNELEKYEDKNDDIQHTREYQRLFGDNDCEYSKYLTTDGTSKKIKIMESIGDGVSEIKLGTTGTYLLVLGFYRFKTNSDIENNNDFYRIDDFSYIPINDKFEVAEYVYFKASGYNVISKKLKKGDSFCIHHDEIIGYPSGMDILMLKKIK